MYIYMYIDIHTYKHIHIYAYIDIHIYVYIIETYIHIFMYKSIIHTRMQNNMYKKMYLSNLTSSSAYIAIDEARCPRSGYSIDMMVHTNHSADDSGMRMQQSCNTLKMSNGWAIEFDGPWHFLECSEPNGATLIKRHHLQVEIYQKSVLC